MVDNPVWAIGERVAGVRALLDDHVAGGKNSAADVSSEGASRAVRARTAAGDVRCRIHSARTMTVALPKADIRLRRKIGRRRSFLATGFGKCESLCRADRG